MDFDFESLDEDVQEYITKLEDLALELRDDVTTLTSAIEKIELEVEEAKVTEGEEGEGKQDELLKSADPSVVTLVKTLEAKVETAQAEATSAQEIAKAERNARLERDFIEKAGSFKNLPGSTEELGQLLKALAEALDEETFAKAIEVLGGADAAIAKAAPWAELGSTFATEAGSGKIDELTKAYQVDHPDLSFEQAMDEVLVANPDVYTEYLNEEGGG